MAVLIPGRLIYLRTPCTASVATENTLVRGISEAIAVVPGHATIDDFRTRKAQTKDGDTVYKLATGMESIVTTIRNPYDMIISWWIKHAGFKVPLWSFIRTFNGRHELRCGRMFFRADEASCIMQYEALDECFATMLRRYGFPPLEIKRDNATPMKKDWQSYYDVQSLTEVNARFGAEIDRYNYEIFSDPSEFSR